MHSACPTFLALASLIGMVLVPAPLVRGQTQTRDGWSVRDMHNPDYEGTNIYAVSETLHAGSGAYLISLEAGPMGPWIEPHAGFWWGSRGTFFRIHPPNSLYSTVTAIAGESLVGGFADPHWNVHAALWPGLGAPVIDLNPAGYAASNIFATNGRQHVGYATKTSGESTGTFAMLWTGTSAEGVRLPTPPGAEVAMAYAISQNQQGGTAYVPNERPNYSSRERASLWNGASGASVDLHPRNAFDSSIRAMTDEYQAGSVNFSPDSYPNPNHAQAALWFGSRESLRIIGGEGSRIQAASGRYQVGAAMVNGANHAMLWASSADSAVDLHALLPPGVTSSSADAIWTDGNRNLIIVGGVADGRAILWTYTPPGAPIFTVEPQSLTVAAGSRFILSAAAVAPTAVSLQWQRAGVALPGATGATLLADQPGVYTVIATSSAGTTASAPAVVSQTVTGYVGLFSNFSIRATTGPGAQALILGTVIGGSGAVSVLARAIGPTLANYGLAGLLPDPVLTLVNDGAVVAANDNWDPDEHLFPNEYGSPFLLADGREAALTRHLPAGAYTLHITGKGSDTGLVLAELYNLGVVEGHAQLSNLSVCTKVEPGNVAIAGFTIAGETAKTVLLRAIGPGLSPLGVEGALVDPKLQLFSGLNLLCENDNWGGSPLFASTGVAVGAFPITNPSSKDAMIAMTLPPGSYTARVSGVQNATGTVLVEVYEVP